MTLPTEPSTITAAQIITMAANVNDQRLITEAIALGEANGVKDPIASISFEPRSGPRLPRLVFVTYQRDENGERYVVHDDGTPYDIASGKPYRYATQQTVVPFKGELPTWWAQAARTPLLPREELS